MRVDDATQKKSWELDRREEKLVAGEQRGKQQKRSWRGRMEGQSTPDTGTERRGDKKGPVKKSLKMSDSSSIVEFSLVTHASDSPYIYYQECTCM